MEKLTKRQLALYELVLSNSKQGRITNQMDIINYYPKQVYEDGYEYNGNPNAHDRCFPIWHDVTIINQNPQVDGIIVMEDFTYRIGTKDEAEAYRKKLYDKAIRSLVRLSYMTRKIKNDGQAVLDESKEEAEIQKFIDAFLK